MADLEEKTPLHEESVVEPDSKAQFVNGGKEPHVAIECGSGDDVSFTGLGKEELMQYADDPFWKKVRLILLIVFWVGWVAMLVAAIVIIVLAPKCPYRPEQKWFDKDTVYEILPESFQDSNPKAEKADTKTGDGVGDITGIQARLDYLKDVVGSKALYINSLYESDDDDRMAIVDHKKIDSVFGTMADFDTLRKATKKMEMRLIMDFIPNHSGKMNEWFKKSQMKDGVYTDYYIWASCDPNTNTYPNNWMSVKGGRAWTYDDTRKECYFHQLESDKPDLNLRSADVRQELESILRFWLDRGVDGFHVQNAQYLYEDENLGDETLITGKTGDNYADFEHNQTMNHPENLKILQGWQNVLESYNTKPGREKALIVTAKDDLNTTMEYFDAGVTIVRVTPLSDSGASFAERIETKLKDANSKRIGWMYGDKYSSRLADRLVNPEQIKALLTLQATLPGVPFNYYGNEIGMTDHPTLSAPNKYRTPMQWNSKGTGFSKNTPWVDRNANYITVNVETEKAIGDEYTTLKVYKRLQELRENESFQWGTMSVYRDGDLLMYTRKADGFPGYLVAINLGTSKVTESFHAATGIPKEVKVVFHTHKDDNSAISLSDTSYILDPSHAVVLEYQ
ncbi:neutral and basic amino acid transport protein rBAT-like [Crassostrea angulata]|uniref:neutral and basic amino acid transport protein rBAT-like n=1 Tax=Magallana angulata TaxID=2784310 RepID=UPI0022B083ED|nr:neutral and basic amino acid transport protein rBAT-like [Crassostrea angulata]